ncbi:MAG: tRNA 2-thiouridine(34) synthase MnmA [Gemmataceae bacterium]|nr:tRNA 2-thiouridine(34) synthase MnmA [Gemmataceae bacterium]
MRVLLAMSGGVDSSVAAALLRQQGHDVVGLFMRTGVHEPAADECDTRASHKKGCCSALDAGDARRVADRLDIPFYSIDFEEDFGRIIDYFADEYLAGRTPNPCVMCNTWLKFGRLWEFAHTVDAEAVATGHYARIEAGQLFRGIDPEKDQSYVLFGLRRETLPRVMFPIGGYRKPEIRAIARELGLPVAAKPDSVDICFVPGGDHAAVVRARRPGAETAGQIVDAAGTVLAEHDGFEQFTVGQRKGLGFAAGSRRYVLEIIPESRQVVVGEPEELQAAGLLASRINWLIAEPTAPLSCGAKIRYRASASEATVHPLPGGGAEVRFHEPQSAVAPGQAVVFYEGERVLGGGWIEKALPL